MPNTRKDIPPSDEFSREFGARFRVGLRLLRQQMEQLECTSADWGSFFCGEQVVSRDDVLRVIDEFAKRRLS